MRVFYCLKIDYRLWGVSNPNHPRHIAHILDHNPGDVGDGVVARGVVLRGFRTLGFVAAVELARLRSARAAFGRSSRQSDNAFIQVDRVHRACEDFVLGRSLAGSAAATEIELFLERPELHSFAARGKRSGRGDYLS